MKSYLKRLSAGLLVLAMLMSSGSMNILASNVSIGNGTTADAEEQVANENDGGVADLEGVGSDSGTTLFGAGGRELTDRENAAFIVRDEWTAWVRGFTASLSELDKNATSRIYDNMDFYDMQYRFTEKYKKVPEYLDEDGKPTQKLKDLIKEKRKKIAGAAGVKDYLKFTSTVNGSTLKYLLRSLPASSVDIGYSLDGSTFVSWAPDKDIVLDAGESVYVWNKKDTLSNSNTAFMRFSTDTNGASGFIVSGNCNSMINFTNVKPNCFVYLFAGTRVVDASELILPSTTLEDSCYRGIFNQCNYLTKAPELPATTLAENCYDEAFDGCIRLEVAPKTLPAKIMKSQCYNNMFANCRQLQVAPEILATDLATYCFYCMFVNCRSLKNIKIAYTGDFDNSYFEYWVDGVSSTGDFYYNGDDVNNFGENAIPLNTTNKWNVHNFTSDLKFTAKQSGSTIKYQKIGTLITDLEMYYSYDDVNWVAWPENTNITLSNEQSIYVKNTKDTLSLSESNYINFVMSGKLAASGDVNALINYRNITPWCYYRLFEGCVSLIEAPELVAKNLAENCYNRMFDGCSGIIQAPSLPATTLVSRCYENMFRGCSSISAPPVISATSIANRSCYYMFANCTQLTTAPELNVMTMEPGCYAGMFNGSGLVNAPELPATTLANSCYSGMFSGCLNLEYAPMDLPATTLAPNCYSSMFSGCIVLTSSPEMKATTLATNCFENMFSSCPQLESIDISFYLGTFDNTYFNNWASGVKDTGTLYYRGTDINNFGASAVPKDSSHRWSVRERQPLTFTSMQDGSTVKYSISDTWHFVPPDMQYSTDAINWTTWSSDTDITLNNGDKIYIRNNKRYLSSSETSHVYFVMSGNIVATGDVNSLIRYGKLTTYCYYRLFGDCTALTGAPELTATTLAPYCYSKMFERCTGLQTAPALPATTLAENCYKFMFSGSGIQTGPDIKATTLASGCFVNMFSSCSSINSVKLAYTGNFTDTYFSRWFDNLIPATGTLYYSGSDTSNFGPSAIPKDASNHWNVQPY